MSIEKRLKDLEKAAGSRTRAAAEIPRAERFQVLEDGETEEERAAKVMQKYGTVENVTFIRIKGR